jgi:hypothetical protein
VLDAEREPWGLEPRPPWLRQREQPELGPSYVKWDPDVEQRPWGRPHGRRVAQEITNRREPPHSYATWRSDLEQDRGAGWYWPV